MKKLIVLIVFAVLCLIGIAMIMMGCSTLKGAIPVDGSSVLYLIVLAVLSIYEVIARLIPTVADISLISWIIKFLKWLSDALNNRKT